MGYVGMYVSSTAVFFPGASRFRFRGSLIGFMSFLGSIEVTLLQKV